MMNTSKLKNLVANRGAAIRAYIAYLDITSLLNVLQVCNSKKITKIDM